LHGEISPSSILQISPVSFAYIGDVVFELYIRTKFLLPPKKISDYHHQVVGKVRAESQAAYLQQLYPLLTDIERNWVRRGKNSVNKSPRRLPLQTYQQATGLETLLGYLYICDRQRLEYILSQIKI
jgi:ribonuclease-3 family protein